MKREYLETLTKQIVQQIYPGAQEEFGEFCIRIGKNDVLSTQDINKCKNSRSPYATLDSMLYKRYYPELSRRKQELYTKLYTMVKKAAPFPVSKKDIVDIVDTMVVITYDFDHFATQID